MEETTLWKLYSLADRYGEYMDTFPKAGHSGYYNIFLFEKMLQIVNFRFLEELSRIEPEQGVGREHYTIAYSYGSRYLHPVSADGTVSEESIWDAGDDILYFMEYPSYGFTFYEQIHFFTFFREWNACVSFYTLEELSREKCDLPSPSAPGWKFYLLEYLFPELVSKDIFFVEYAYDFTCNVIWSVEDENYSNFFCVRSLDKLHAFVQWVEEIPSRRNLAESRKILALREKIKTIVSHAGAVVQYVETPVGCYLCYSYLWDESWQSYCDGRTIPPFHFYDLYKMEILLRLAEKYK